MLSAADHQSHPAVESVVIIFLIGAMIYAFGYARAVMHRANRDYKTTKAAVPTLRKGFWHAWWGAVKFGFWIVLVVVVLGMWVWHDVRQPDQASDVKPSVAPSSRHASQRSPGHRNG